MDDPPDIFRGTGGRSPLQNFVRAHLPGFLAEFEDEHGGRSLPKYVIQEFEALLECGDPAFGFSRLRCPSCATDTIVPFSCKGRTICSSCGGRQMAQTAAHIVDRVFPDVDVRQWVLTVPKPLRLAMAMNAELCREVTRAHIRAVSASYKRRGQVILDRQRQEMQGDPKGDPVEAAASVPDSLVRVRLDVGAVNSTQRFESSLGLNVHQHSLYLDGVYVTRGPFDPPVFLPTGPLKSDEVERVHGDVIKRIRRVLERYGLDPIALGLPPRAGDEAPAEFADSSEHEHQLLDFGDARDDAFFPALKAASVKSLVPFGPGAGQPLKRLIDPDLSRAFQSSGWGSQYVPPPLVMNAGGFSLHAATLIRKGQRAQLEKLCRYVTRPAISLERFEVRPDGMVSWLLRKPWKDGTKGFVMTPYQFLARLAAIVPHPREHQLTYQGVLAPASPLRDQVVPRPVVRKEPKDVDVADDDVSMGLGEPPKSQSYICWADLLKRVFGEDVLRCPRCRGRRHMISVITDRETARKVLEGVRAAARRSSGSLGGGDPSSPGPSRSPPAESEVRIPMPLRQGRLDFGK
ncbi:Putative transposase [Planctomycetes bacterium Poly30]|uniref:Transposase n=1 Tax=Saltatorellus ferox TaxID=2528018 RepID=A0A518ENZ2_9BACT|nr:Putative transposase [Planctomycetes bacterium Poly30]